MWAIIVNILVGLWIMTSATVLQLTGAPADNNYIVGPLIITFSVIALWDINRSVRYCNVPIGVWLAVSTFVLPIHGTGVWSNIVAGILVATLSFIPAASKKPFGGGWKSLFEEEPAHMRAKGL